MPEWQERLRKYGNNSVWQATRKEFNSALGRLQNSVMPRDVGQLCSAMAALGLGLEHEAVWLPA